MDELPHVHRTTELENEDWFRAGDTIRDTVYEEQYEVPENCYGEETKEVVVNTSSEENPSQRSHSQVSSKSEGGDQGHFENLSEAADDHSNASDGLD